MSNSDNTTRKSKSPKIRQESKVIYAVKSRPAIEEKINSAVRKTFESNSNNDLPMPVLVQTDAMPRNVGATMPELVKNSSSDEKRSIRNKRKKEVFDPSDFQPTGIPTTGTSLLKKIKEEEPESIVVTTPPQQKKRGRPKSNESTPTGQGGRKDGSSSGGGGSASSTSRSKTTRSPNSKLCHECKHYRNRESTYERFVNCKRCRKYFHPSCLGIIPSENRDFTCSSCENSQNGLNNIPDTSPAKLCKICNTSYTPNSIGDDGETCGNCPLIVKNELQIKKENITEEEVVVKPPPAPKRKYVKKADRSEALVQNKEVVLESSPVVEPELTPVTEQLIEPHVEVNEILPQPPPIPSPPTQLAIQSVPVEPHSSIELNPNIGFHQQHMQLVKVHQPQPIKPIVLSHDPLTWSVNEVDYFFKANGLSDEGTIFREQEIDGLSLLLMKRSDIIHGMKLKLGPALKVYRLVNELQCKSVGS